MTEFVEKYLEILNCDDAMKHVSIENLFTLQQKHLENVVFNSSACYLGKEMKITEDYLLREVVIEKQGGFCFVMNSSFYCLLKDLGYDVVLYPCTVYNGFTNKIAADSAPDHICLIVHFTNESYLVDVGFCLRGFYSPIKFEEGVTDQGRHGSFKLSNSDDSLWFLQSKNKYRSLIYPASKPDEWYNEFQINISKEINLQDVDRLTQYHLKDEKFIFKKVLCFESIKQNSVLSLWDDQFRSVVFGDTVEDDVVQCEKIISEEHRQQILKEHYDFDYNVCSINQSSILPSHALL